LDNAVPDDGDPFSDQVSYTQLPAGKYVVSERAHVDMSLTSLACVGASDSKVEIDLATHKVTINLAQNEHVTCTFEHGAANYDICLPLVLNLP
jgi:hypothetical protein